MLLMNLIAIILDTILNFYEIRKLKVQSSLRGIQIFTYCQMFKLQFYQNNIFPLVSVHVCNVRDIFFVSFYIEGMCTDRNKSRKHHHETTLDFTNLRAKLLNLCSWKIQKAKWHFSGLDIWRFRFSGVCLRAVERFTLLRFLFCMHPY